MPILLSFLTRGCPRPILLMAEMPEEKQKPIMSLKAKVRTHALSLLILLAKVSLMTQPSQRVGRKVTPPPPSVGGISPVIQRGTEDRQQ